MLWAERPEDGEGEQRADTEAHGDVDESFAARRLRRWIKGMFGGEGKPAAAEPPKKPGREPEEA